MRIISTLPEKTLLQSTPERQPVEKLLQHHPAAILFDISPIEHNAKSAAFEFKIRDICTGARSDMSSFAGCMIDLAVRAFALPTLGSCELSEYEIHMHAPLDAKALQVRVYIESTMAQCATFCCAISSIAAGKPLILAEAQGTLLSQSPSLETPTRHCG